MECLYRNLLVPELYPESGRVAQFIEGLLEPEIDTASDLELEQLAAHILPTDDIADRLQTVEKETQEGIRKCGTSPPSFFAFYGNHRKPIRLLSDNPKTKPHVSNLLYAGKCMAMATAAHSIFFRSLVYHRKGEVYANQLDSMDYQEGIHVIGSSIRGNCFVSLSSIEKNDSKITFAPVSQKITREGEYDYPFGQFFGIEDHIEMRQIIQQCENIAHKLNLTHHQCLINFATTFKALLKFGYTV